MPLRFDNPEELMEIFSTLEEQNLFMIELCQDVEMQFEDKKQQERKVHNSLQSMVDKLRANEKANDDKIKKTIKEKDAIMGVHDDGDGKGIESSD